ncbi:sensor histidine kinase [Novispirillum sp. DQ9]|uniref:sensor histidine kinase n=1 Tax=Novispirillum sp. DQ9 TaxID=3398612 RepID=UPI003C7BEFF3
MMDVISQIASPSAASPDPSSPSAAGGGRRLRLGTAAVVGAVSGAILVAVAAILILGSFARIVSIAEKARDEVVPLVLEQQEQALLAIELARLTEVILGARSRLDRRQALEDVEAVAQRIAGRADVTVMGRLDAAVHAVRRSAYRGDVLDALRDSASAHLDRLDGLLPPLGGVRGRIEPYATQLLFEIRHVLYRAVEEPDASLLDTLEARFAVLVAEMRDIAGGGDVPATGGRAFSLRDLDEFKVVFGLRREQLLVQQQMAGEAVTARGLLAALSNALSADASATALDSSAEIVRQGRTGIIVGIAAVGGGLVALFLGAWLLVRHVAAPVLRAHGALEAVQRGQRMVNLPPARLEEVDAVGRSVERLAQVLAEVQVKEQAAQRSQRQLRFIFDVSPVPFIMARVDTSEIIDANEAACKLFRSDRATIVGRLSRDYWLDPRRRDAMVEYLRREGAVDDFEAHMLTADGHDFWALMSVRMVELDVGPALLTGVTDITERKAYEVRLHGLVTELEASNQELERFAAVASHDLQEPLRAVASHLQLLERREGPRLSDEGREFMGFAIDGARRMQHLIVDLLEYARIGQTRAEPEPVGLGPLLDVVRRTLGPRLEETRGVLETVGPLPTVLGDPDTLMRLFENLITNALKYGAPDRDPLVRISAEAAGDHWQVSVADNGRGIAPEYTDKVFMMFQRLDSGDGTTGMGTGIGLTICRKIVEQHGGRIWADPDGGCGPGGAGVAFRLTLPMAP